MKKILAIALLIMTMVAVAACSNGPAEKMIISAVTPKNNETVPETVECVEWTTKAAVTSEPTCVSGTIAVETTSEPTVKPIETVKPIAEPTSEITHVVIEDEEYDIAYETEDASYDGPWPIEKEEEQYHSNICPNISNMNTDEAYGIINDWMESIGK